jgi:hypothetical protein
MAHYIKSRFKESIGFLLVLVIAFSAFSSFVLLNPSPSYAFNSADFNRAFNGNKNLSGVDLSGADLRGVDLRGADLSGAKLNGADLSGTDLSGAKLNGADLSGAIYNSATKFSATFDPTKAGARTDWY